MCKNGIGCYHRALAYHYSFCTCQDFSTSSNHCPLADNNSTKRPIRIFSTQSNIVIDSCPIFNRYQWVHYRAVTIVHQGNALTEFYTLWDINSKALHDDLTKKTNRRKFPQLQRTPKYPPIKHLYFLRLSIPLYIFLLFVIMLEYIENIYSF